MTNTITSFTDTQAAAIWATSMNPLFRDEFEWFRSKLIDGEKLEETISAKFRLENPEHPDVIRYNHLCNTILPEYKTRICEELTGITFSR